MKTITCLSSSGTGKTTNFSQITYYLALHGYRINSIELDDRNSFKAAYGLDPVDPQKSTSILFDKDFNGNYPFKLLWEKCLKGKAQAIQAHRDEQKKTIVNLTQTGDAIVLNRTLRKYPPSNCDLLILDCPGRSDIMSDAAILASDYLLLGIEATEKCFEDVSYFLEYLYKLTDAWKVPAPIISGFLIGRCDLNSSYQRQALKQLLEIAKELGVELFNPIRNSACYFNAYSAGLPIAVNSTGFKGSSDFIVDGNFFKRKNKQLSSFSSEFKELPAIVPYLEGLINGKN